MSKNAKHQLKAIQEKQTNDVPKKKLEDNVSNKKSRNTCYTYRVNVCRISYGNLAIKVVARNAREAKRLAEDQAGNFSFTEHTSEYQAQSVTRLEQLQPFMGG